MDYSNENINFLKNYQLYIEYLERDIKELKDKIEKLKIENQVITQKYIKLLEKKCNINI